MTEVGRFHESSVVFMSAEGLAAMGVDVGVQQMERDSVFRQGRHDS